MVPRPIQKLKVWVDPIGNGIYRTISYAGYWGNKSHWHVKFYRLQSSDTLVLIGRAKNGGLLSFSTSSRALNKQKIPRLPNLPIKLVYQKCDKQTKVRPRPSKKALAAPARGGGWSDCNQRAGPKRRIKGCTQIISVGGSGTRNTSIAYNIRGVTYYRLKQYRLAMQDYNYAIRLNPRSAVVYRNRALVYLRLNQYRRSIQDLNKAIRLDPSSTVAHGNRGYSYEMLGQKQLAIRDFRMVLRLSPGDIRATAGLRRLGVKP
jgi:tetratricopeptide (TPR) repeat protein